MALAVRNLEMLCLRLQIEVGDGQIDWESFAFSAGPVYL